MSERHGTSIEWTLCAVEGRDLAANALALSVGRLVAACPSTAPGIGRERSDQRGLTVLDAKERQENLREQSGSLPRDLNAPLRTVVRMTPQVRLVVQLDGTGVEHLGNPVDHCAAGHSDADGRVTGLLDCGDVETPLTVDQPGEVRHLFTRERSNRIRWACRQELGAKARIPLAIVALLGSETSGKV